MRPFSLIHIPAGHEIGIEVRGEDPCFIVVFVAPKMKSREEFLKGLHNNHSPEESK
jgi:hypothetical protein